jgi:putative ABC transport system ATP-binding protein
MNPACQLRDVRFAYRRSKYTLQIPRLEVVIGEKVFLYGPSGCGKTTLLGGVARALPGQSGVVKVLGQDRWKGDSECLCRSRLLLRPLTCTWRRW